jgi:beta-glucanase (GH16 family)
MLWPAGPGWPPEIDFSEDFGRGARDTAYATLHYGSDDSQIQKSVSVDLTEWHTLGVEWTRGRLVYTLDGQDWATVVGAAVPDVLMVLDMQTGANNCGTWEPCPTDATPSEVDMDIRWVVAYAPAN